MQTSFKQWGCPEIGKGSVLSIMVLLWGPVLTGQAEKPYSRAERRAQDWPVEISFQYRHRIEPSAQLQGEH